MSNHTNPTEIFVNKHLLAMFAAAPHEAEDAFIEYAERVEEVVGDNIRPDSTNFEWPTLYGIIDEHNEGPEKRKEVVAAVGRTSISVLGYPPRMGEYHPVHLHDPEGMFITVTPEGVPVAAANVFNARVPSKYNAGDPYVLLQLGEAKLVEAVMHQGADRGEGHEYLVRFERERGLLAGGKPKHIGMATLYEVPYNDTITGTNSSALAYTGTSGRTLNPTARSYIMRDHPAVAERMVNGFDGVPHPDDLAGIIDTLSGTVANKAAVHGVARSVFIPSQCLVEFPNPEHPEHAGVDWN